MKFCKYCKKDKVLTEFKKDSRNKSGRAEICRQCHNQRRCKSSGIRRRKWNTDLARKRYHRNLYKAGKAKRTPQWADKEKIKEIYNKCPTGCHVDHVIPLRGKSVSGLHVETNLQYLTAEANIAKRNHYEEN